MKSVRLSNNNLFSKIEYSSLYLKVGSCTSVIFRITMQPNNTENNIKSNFSVCCVPPPPLIPTHPTPSSTLSPPSPHCFLHCYIATLLHCYIATLLHSSPNCLLPMGPTPSPPHWDHALHPQHILLHCFGTIAPPPHWYQCIGPNPNHTGNTEYFSILTKYYTGTDGPNQNNTGNIMARYYGHIFEKSPHSYLSATKSLW